MNLVPKLGTISSMVHLEEGTCVAVWLWSVPLLGEGCSGAGREDLGDGVTLHQAG